jgi:predicted nucleic acid-binding protein
MISLDTNVLIYSCDKRDLRRQRAALDLVASASDGILLWQVACEFVAASRKLAPYGFTTVDAWERLADFMAIFPLILPTPGALDRARLLHEKNKWSFWDAMIVASCVEAGVTRMYSEDLPGSTGLEPLEIVNPFA